MIPLMKLQSINIYDNIKIVDLFTKYLWDGSRLWNLRGPLKKMKNTFHKNHLSTHSLSEWNMLEYKLGF